MRKAVVQSLLIAIGVVVVVAAAPVQRQCDKDVCDYDALLQNKVLLDSSGELTSENLPDADVHKATPFDQIDANSDGSISRKEMKNGMDILDKARGIDGYDDQEVKPQTHNPKHQVNGKGDFDAFLSSLVVNVIGFGTMCCVFTMLYRRYPIMYSDNVLKGTAPREIPEGYLGWVQASWSVTTDEVEKTAGLDAAMLLQFDSLALRVCTTIGVPMVLILCPMHFLAGNEATDRLSKVGMGNISGKNGSCYWVHAVFVWFVVYVTQRAVCEFQEKFIYRRYDWLLRMPSPRSNTVMVEGIPEQHRTDDALKSCFDQMFPGGKVEKAYVVRKTAHLETLVERYETAKQGLTEANFEWQANGATEDDRPIFKPFVTVRGAVTTDKITYYEERKEDAAAAVIAERVRLNDPATDKSEVYSSNGFVTFKTELDAKFAMHMKIRADEEEFQLSRPPDPSDIQYDDLYANPAGLQAAAAVGYACIACLFFGFTSIVLAISALVNLEALRRQFELVDHFVKAYPASQAMLQGVLASLALTLFMGFLPTFLNLIFSFFFQLKAGRWAQYQIQIWYYWFMVVFVLLETAVGSSLLDTMKQLVHHPLGIFGLLADRLPASTHFYLTFMAMQWTVQGMNLTRYVQLMKFKALSAICDEARAKELAEPEDQDYYGMGARSARHTLNLVIALVYCSLCPLITVVTGINFLIARVVFGYLLVFAETPKPDLGGVFWVNCLTQVQKALFIYISLMLGVLYNRAASQGPALVVVPCLLYAAREYSRFHSAYEWETVPFEEFVETQKRKACWPKDAIRPSTRDTYAQAELTEPKLGLEPYRRSPPRSPSMSDARVA